MLRLVFPHPLCFCCFVVGAYLSLWYFLPSSLCSHGCHYGYCDRNVNADNISLQLHIQDWNGESQAKRYWSDAGFPARAINITPQDKRGLSGILAEIVGNLYR